MPKKVTRAEQSARRVLAIAARKLRREKQATRRRKIAAKTKPTKAPLHELLTNQVFSRVVAKLTGWPVAIVLIALIVAATNREALPQTMQAILAALRSIRGR